MSPTDPLPLLAGALERARESRCGIAAPSDSYPWLTIDDAYAVQLSVVHARIEAGAVIRGYKVGLTSKAMQSQFGIDQPDFGHLLDDMFLPDSQPITAADYLQPRVEPEIAFVMSHELSGPVDVEQAEAAVDHVLPCLELIDSRIENWRVKLVDTIADNAAAAGVILGARPAKLSQLDLAAVSCHIEAGSYHDHGLGSAVMGSPINAVVWLANTLGARGVSFAPGDVILAGALTAAKPVSAGDRVTATFSGLGSVSALLV